MAVEDEAQAALDAVQDDPTRALERAAAVLAAAGCSPTAAVVARWAGGRAHQELGRLAEACEWLHRAERDAAALGDGATGGRIAMSLSWALMSAGDTAGAFAALDRADRVLAGTEHARVVMQRGLLQFQLGRLDEALASFDAARPVLRRGGDLVGEARLLVNRAAVATSTGRLGAAERDLARAVVLAGRCGQRLLLAGAEHNLGFLHAGRGDVPAALAHYERAAEAYRALDGPGRLLAVLAADRGEALLAAGLGVEAQEDADTALREFERAGDAANADQALLQRARADLVAGDPAAALGRAHRAEDRFRRAGRLPWAALAAYTGLRAQAASSEEADRPPPDLLARARRIESELRQEGWAVEAAHARTLVARLAVASGAVGTARDALAPPPSGRRPPPAVQVQVWHVRALVALAEGDRRRARAAVRTGLAVVDRHRAAFGARELRANAAALGVDLARLGLRLALEDGRPAAVLAAAERHRAGSLDVPAVRPPADERLAEALADLRRADAGHRDAVLAGGADRTTADAVHRAERRVLHLSRLAGTGAGSARARPTVRALRAALEERILVELVALEGRLTAVVVDPHRSRLVDLGGTDAARRELDHLSGALRRRLRGHLADPGPGRSAALDRADRASADAASRLDALLLAPLGLDDRVELVLVPTAPLHGVPWAALPSLRGRPFTVAPSAALWLRPRRDTARGATLLVAGPDLPGADAEVAALAGVWPDAAVLSGAAASGASVLDAMSGADLVHVAAHGTFRSDSPLFSSLRLVDGPLTVHDLETLAPAPATVVLPACHAGVHDVRHGDELLGATAALLGVGVRSVVAPVLALPDAATVGVVVDLHRHLAAGRPVAAALAAASADARARDDPLGHLVADVLVATGADDRPPGDASPVSAERPERGVSG